VITRTSAGTFNLGAIGAYSVTFQVSIAEAGQLLLTLDGTELTTTTAGRATGTSQIMGVAIITTTAINSTLTVRNPSGAVSALTVLPLAGGTLPVTAHLVIVRLR
jgi:hypothetical protein